MLYEEMCDGFVHLLPEVVDTQNHTDETECDHWPCYTIYTRCNSFRDCPNGEDEENYIALICNPPSQLCLIPHSYMMTCLSADRVSDGIVDCFGASDERDYCENTNLRFQLTYFWCWNITQCISSFYLYDGN
jgi:hypothetical protein